ncbi:MULTISPECIES: hypothetical protein [unclassified Breznakia]|uniref:hypothetical protein n=1 Tax=unclassified Breznakia TaxID=2623764 RepID=UPI002473CC40|nr:MULTISPECIES: hypothetical protein [unclassified Breznakia]MDH6367396.1 hypothetical protein [Breznakia sp. PH1-1]MDH6403928.1 hypothetical protein [Breznakia sp. PF1-11]MDH6411637.1 hypothetical protein [Breznakia sp. PFB1-11]MDH6414563.1 hypothetical protein [Breznakia sp. PFB1-14]MDH6418669.1 hypothetical protein [Breznakia sp. PFB1-12]
MTKNFGVYKNKEWINKIYNVIKFHNNLCEAHQRICYEIVQEQIENASDEYLVSLYYYYSKQVENLEKEIFRINERRI